MDHYMQGGQRSPRLTAVLLFAAILTACVDNERRADVLADDFHFDKQLVTGAGFRHVIYRNSSPVPAGTLHVYIEGDGIPFEKRDLVAKDPTPRNLLMLRLMRQDSNASIYVGRPCYFGLFKDGDCNLLWWTLRRYSSEVLASMVEVVRAQAAQINAQSIEVYGHSGGGTLALLIAEQIPTVSRVVTIGANLDLAAWTQLHDYSALQGSISPIEAAPLRGDLRVLHLVGSRDTNTPPWLIQHAAQLRGGETVAVIDGFDHVCCWELQWHSILSAD
jgi:hypothetical protein